MAYRTKELQHVQYLWKDEEAARLEGLDRLPPPQRSAVERLIAVMVDPDTFRP